MQKWQKTADLLFGGHGLGVHSVLGLALISAIRSLNLALSEVTVLYAWREKKHNKIYDIADGGFLK